MTDIEQFRVAIPEADIYDLHGRLDKVRWPDELPDVGWSYGVPRDYLQELARYWRHDYDWRAAESKLNSWRQFTTVIDGLRLHFAHIRSPHPNATPLLMTHGWPGSIVEFGQVVDPLVNPTAHGGDMQDAFHLVIPSIPGFGFSERPREPRWGPARVAAAFASLMKRLGYAHYGAQGGDWGSIISRNLALQFPERVTGVHLNLLLEANPRQAPDSAEMETLDPVERERTLASWAAYQHWRAERSAYSLIQATRPQTLAYALNDSPIGQLAWITEKFFEWSDSSARPEEAIDRDALLTNVSIYWFTQTAGSSARIYYERAHAETSAPSYSSTPTALAVFPHDINIPVRHVAERSSNIVRWTEFDRGGHFAALEQPDLLVGDIRGFFAQLRDG